MVLSKERLNNVCKLEQVGQCRFVIPGPDGFECGKGTPLGTHINQMVDQERPGFSTGDNCEGKNKEEV